MADLTLGGTNIRTRHAIFLDLMSGYFEPAEVRGVDTTIPSADGQTLRNRVVHRRVISLVGYVEGTSVANWNANTTTLMALLDPTTTQTLVIGDGYLGTAATPEIVVRFVNAVPGIPIKGPTFQTWSLEFVSVTPEWTP